MIRRLSVHTKPSVSKLVLARLLAEKGKVPIES